MIIKTEYEYTANGEPIPTKTVDKTLMVTIPLNEYKTLISDNTALRKDIGLLREDLSKAENYIVSHGMGDDYYPS